MFNLENSNINTKILIALLTIAICLTYTVQSWCQVTIKTGSPYMCGTSQTYTANQVLEVGPNSCAIAEILYPPSTSEIVGDIGRYDCTNFMKVSNYWWGYRYTYDGRTYYADYAQNSADYKKEMELRFTNLQDDQVHALVIDPVTWDAFICIDGGYWNGWIRSGQLSSHSDVAVLTYKAVPIKASLSPDEQTLDPSSGVGATVSMSISPSGYEWDTYTWLLELPFNSYQGAPNIYWNGTQKIAELSFKRRYC